MLNVDFLWHAPEIFHKAERQRPNGLMDQLTSEKNKVKVKSIITMVLLLIDLNPSHESYSYSTLIHITGQAKHLNAEIPCITFDQRL